MLPEHPLCECTHGELTMCWLAVVVGECGQAEHGQVYIGDLSCSHDSTPFPSSWG